MQRSITENAFRDEIWDIMKGIGIFLMVLGHSGCPSFLRAFVYAFHMPLFFMISGLLIKQVYFDNKIIFFKKRVKSLYLPCVKWSVIFILLHDVFFILGIIHPYYGYMGHGSGWYSFYDLFYKIVVVVLTMNNSEHLLGAFWFIKSLFVSTVFFVMLYSRLRQWKYVWLLPLFVLLLNYTNLLVMNEKNMMFFEDRFIGHFELFGLFFVSFGFVLKSYIPLIYDVRKMILSLVLLFLISFYAPVSMGPNLKNVIILPFSALFGFVLIYNLSCFVTNKLTILRKLLKMMGEKSFYILLFHFLSFKLVSLLKVVLFDLDYGMIAEHPVVQFHNEYFWIMYTFIGVFGSLFLGKIVNYVPFLRR